MGKPLSYKEALANVRKLRILKNLKHLPAVGLNVLRTNLNVEVFENDESIIKDYFPVSFTYKENFSDSRSKSDWYDINIFWEENGLTNYRDLGLFGIYSTDYNKIELDTAELEILIHSDNGILIKIYL
ncbi:hypothetical protein ABEX53_17290 [Bacillus toyonensis]|uniref:hypothetical protein n=1 Tax=Bacillus toyonensis TaxID=155322 RepID=UPI000CD8AA0D|nr:hypothetical protein [Bacillus toyonensis]MED3538284.1 hypothetical protein [Bacillus toyonensis]MEE2017020.1 hypothetical protein [Bacillus toyonensis]